MAASATAPPDLVREELGRLMDSESMRRAPSHARLLRYLVERRVAGDETALRETSIALEVFRRDPATYDPRTDPIVRVSVRRLRDRLEAHYAHYDAPPKLRIVLPRGGYAPEFVPLPGASAAPAGLAVLRTRNLTGEDAFDPIAHGFAEQLADRLAHAGLPRVVARASVDRAQATTDDPRALGSRLGVPWLLDSTLAREPQNALRLSARLLASDGAVRWVETAVANDGDRYRLVDRMLDSVALRVLDTLPGGARALPAAAQADALPDAARTALLRSRMMLMQRSVPATDEALALAETTASSHPRSADAWAALAAALYSRLSFCDRDPEPLAARAIEAATRALALDPEHVVALRTRAIFVAKADGDFDAARDLFERALRSLPSDTSTRLNYAELLTYAGRFDESLVQLNLARAHDPLSSSVHIARAACLYLQRRYEDADEAWLLCRASGDTSLWTVAGRGMNALAAGRLDDAQAMIGEALAQAPGQPRLVVWQACIHAARGEHDRALACERECAKQSPWLSPAHRAMPAAIRRDRETTLRLIAEALDRRDLGLPFVSMDRALDWLAGDPDYERLRQRSPMWAARAARISPVPDRP